MKLPTGMTESQVLTTIDRAIKNLAETYKFGYYDEEDMMQEGRIYALEALESYDASRDCSLEQFLRVHVRNRFKNLRRDKMERRELPCYTCPFFESPDLCNAYTDKLECSRWFGWVERNTMKRNLVESIASGDATEALDHVEFDYSESMICREIFTVIEEHMPLHMRADYRRYLEGVRLPKVRRIRVEETIREIVRDEYGI